MTKIAKTGNPRKSRRKRLNVSGGTGPEEKFVPEAADWDRIEVAYRQKLGAAEREAIVTFVNRYFFWQPNEANAPFADDALRYLDLLEKRGTSFWRVMFEREPSPVSSREAELRDGAAFFVQMQFGRHLQDLDFHRKTDWNGLIDTMTAYPRFAELGNT